MKIVQIHSGTLGSIGTIIADISSELTDKNIENYAVLADCSYQQKPDNYIIFSNQKRNKFNRLMGQLTGYTNCFSFKATRTLIKELERIQPDIIHLHNLHDGYINTKKLFHYLASCDKKVVWTLHDGWAFTGKCPYFDVSECEKWKTECGKCPVYKNYPKAEFDRTKYLYHLKKNAFTSVKNLHLVTPSQWLYDRVKESFLRDLPISVIYNGININVFQPKTSNLREKYNLGNKQIILGVAAPFDSRKGVHIFERLANELPADEYAIVMIGLDKKQIENMPDSIVKIHRTSNQQELAEWYTVANIFLNPTYEEVLGMTNLEAMACGTPVITFNSGGSPETITEKTGFVFKRDDYIGVYELLLSKKYVGICSDACIERAKKFTKKDMASSYIKLYKSLS